MYLANKKTTIYSSFLIFLIRLNLKIIYIIHSNLIYAYTTILTVLLLLRLKGNSNGDYDQETGWPFRAVVR